MDLSKMTPKVLEHMLVDELKDVCRSNEITGFSGKNKDELIKMISKERKKRKEKEEETYGGPSKKIKIQGNIATQEHKVPDVMAIAKAKQEVQEASDKLAAKKLELAKLLQKVEEAEADLMEKQEKLKRAEAKKKTTVNKFILVPIQ